MTFLHMCYRHEKAKSQILEVIATLHHKRVAQATPSAKTTDQS